MANSKKSKWLIGLTGTALSAFVIGQVGGNQPNGETQSMISAPIDSMSKQEQEYVQLDWSNYEVNGVKVIGVENRDRQTRRT
ncbi:hypothetical protein [Bacillus sp. FJAT-29814]|uniref:hypothetical protein n=1 Tax=Bacillus sp. FJAT-29814 TaxID=1729688 RepID=UPI0008302970|nr:hypothetical protein [Bacillus sp. FJAT-29814]